MRITRKPKQGSRWSITISSLVLYFSVVFAALAVGDERKPWITNSRLHGSPDGYPAFMVARVFPLLEFKQPVVMTNAPGTNRLFVAELNGKIYSFDPSDPGKKDLFIDLKKEVKGFTRVYGLTFHPKSQSNRECFICYVLEDNLDQGTRVARFTLTSSNPPRIEPGSEEIILKWRSGGHNGGCLKFGPKDGYLYISAGDGGPAFPPDPRKTGQDISDLLAGVVRIDVDNPSDGLKYSVPKDNPFVKHPKARPEVWAFGMRNPWKMSFDLKNGSLWVGDVGWELWEMIYRVQPGGNYGWSIVEGRQPVHEERPRGPTPILEPTIAHSHTESRSITGGHVYHGNKHKSLDGHYLYGDYVTGKIWSCKDRNGKLKVEEIAQTRLQIICFGRDNHGEVYVVDYQGGIYQFEANPKVNQHQEFPNMLSETGLFADIKKRQLAAGVQPYEIIAEPWADGAHAERFLALPGKSQLGLHDKQNVWLGAIKGDWQYPDGAVIGKTISIETRHGDSSSRRLLETQILLMDEDTWHPLSFIWNDDQTDAELAPIGGFDREYAIVNAEGEKETFKWHFSSRTECLLCHTTRGGSVYGLQPAQLDRLVKVKGKSVNQLQHLGELGYFAKPIGKRKIKMVDPYDKGTPIEERARSYLHVNCAHCHRRGGGGTAAMDVRIELTLDKTNLLNARPTQGAFSIHGAEVFAEGDPFRSLIYYRMAKTGKGRMPHIGSFRVDDDGLQLMKDWISSFQDSRIRASVQSLRARQRRLANQLLDKHPGDDVIKELMTTTSGALLAAEMLSHGKIEANVKKRLVDQAQNSSPTVRDLFERFLPEDQRAKRLGSSIKPADILKVRGDAGRGRAFFAGSSLSNCRNCHRVGNTGKQVGPDLTDVGKRMTKAQILESILQPSKQIDPKYVTYLIETTRGRVHAGVLISRNKSTTKLRTADGKEVSLSAEDIELITPQQKSLMPELLFKDLTIQHAADLLEFLAQQKK